MTNALIDHSTARWLTEEPLFVDISLGIIQAGYAAPALTCHLVPRCEGIVARFTVRGPGGTHDVYARQARYSEATYALQQAWGMGLMTATRFLHHAETIAWAGLADRGVEVPADFLPEVDA